MWVISMNDLLGKFVCCLGMRMAFGRSSDIFKSNHLKMHVSQCLTCLELSKHFTFSSNKDQNTAAPLLHFILGHFPPGSLGSSHIGFIFVLRKPLYYLTVFRCFLHL